MCKNFHYFLWFGRNEKGYVRRCVKEALRLYPVAPFLTRVAMQQIRLQDGANEYLVEPGSAILMGTYAMGRDPRYFTDPDTFDPDRWDRSARVRKPGSGFAVLPFGFGARRCIGKAIAEEAMHQLISGMVKRSFSPLKLGFE